MTTLIERLYSAGTGTRDLDAEIVAQQNNALVKPYPPATDFGPSSKWQFWSLDGQHFLGNESRFPVPPVTTSLDAAMGLAKRVLDHTEMRLDIDTHGGTRAIVEHEHAIHIGNGLSPSLALCIAVLKASQPTTNKETQ